MLRHLAQHPWHDPAESAREPEIIEYLKTPPTREHLIELLRAMGFSIFATCGWRRPRLDVSQGQSSSLDRRD
jgi:arsenate reductase-like glutaredoxin family protein